MRNFAAARDLQATSAQYRSEYAGKAEGYLADLVNWLRQYLITHLEVTFEGRTRPVCDVLAEARTSEADSIAALLNLVAGQLLEPTFAGAYPHYPAFRRAQVTITESARDLTATQALRAMVGMRRTGLAEAVLDGLRLLGPDGAIRPYDSPYAQRLLQRLNAKPEGQVVNRSEVVEVVAGGVDNPLEKEIDFHLEPEWLAVLLAALVYSGDIELTVNGKDINAGNIAELGSMTARQVAAFRHYRRPPTLPVGRWADIFEALDLPAGLVRDENTREQAVRDLQAKVGAGLRDLAVLDRRVTQGPRLWNMPLFTDSLAIQSQDGLVIGSDAPAVRFGQADVLPHLRAYRRLLDGLQPYNTVGKLRHLRVQPQDVADGAAGGPWPPDERPLAPPRPVPGAGGLPGRGGPHLPEGTSARRADPHARGASGRPPPYGPRRGPVQPGDWTSQLSALRERYVRAYAEEHRRLVLGPRADERRQRITRGEALGLVRALDQLRILPSHDLRAWQRDLQALKACPEFHEGSWPMTRSARTAG